MAEEIVLRREEGTRLKEVCSAVPTGKRPLGRTKMRWYDQVKRDVSQCGGTVEMAADREAWKRLIYEAKNRLRFVAPQHLFSTFVGSMVPVVVAATSSKQKIQLVDKMREVDFLLHNKLGPPRKPDSFTTVLPSGLLPSRLFWSTAFINEFYLLHTCPAHPNLLVVIIFGMLEVMEIVLSVRERFRLVNERVLDLVMRSRSKQLMWTMALPCVETFTMPQETKMTLPGLSEIHWSLCCIVYDINSIYGCQCVTAMIYLFTYLVYTPYLLFVLYDNMAKSTVAIVAKLMGNIMAKPLFEELETFADQLFHRDVEFTACGLFTLQTSLVISVASAVTTYMAIIIQFQASSEDVTTKAQTSPVTQASSNSSPQQ
ncbi:uncharacterized protein LOC128988540 [Macrosteles quadrilineatus]|uniref:uncharacterized protein LOC128988540 n=1 Tax=Macrosteles quadrilineatus TaxID=74068 RepID=UPI0023E1EA64|nr:uncharacterized protein LOC128988540 [Macrosteles quadrilineatus]